MKINTYSTFIFDLDGTLLNTLDDLAASTNYALRTHGMPERTVDEVRHFVGNGVRLLMERAVPGGEQNPLFDDAYSTFRHHYMEHQLDHTRPYDGVEDTLHELKQRGCHLAIVSNKFYPATVALARHFFPDTIEVAIGERENIRKKPAPDTVIEAMRQLKTQPSDKTVYVGDSDVDILTARNSQLPCISVTWGFRSRQFLIDNGASTLIEAPSDLLRFAPQS